MYAIAQSPEGVKPSADAKLFALEAEMKAAYDGLRADPGSDHEHQVWYDRIDAADEATRTTPAQTAAGAQGALGVAIKLRVALDHQEEVHGPDFRFTAMASVLDDVDRLAGFKEPQQVWRAS